MHFSQKHHMTDRRTDQPMNQPWTDTPSYRDVRTHLKSKGLTKIASCLSYCQYHRVILLLSLFSSSLLLSSSSLLLSLFLLLLLLLLLLVLLSLLSCLSLLLHLDHGNTSLSIHFGEAEPESRLPRLAWISSALEILLRRDSIFLSISIRVYPDRRDPSRANHLMVPDSPGQTPNGPRIDFR